MSIDTLHLDLYQLIFDYLMQQDLLNLLLIGNHTFYQQVMKYIPKLLKIEHYEHLYFCGKMNMIISIKLNTTALQWNWGLEGACLGGHIQLAEWFIKKGADNYSYGLFGACEGGHIDCVELMIKYDTCIFNLGLCGACKGGHKEIAELMIEKGACNWNWALYDACKYNHKMLIKLMIENGATLCDYCGKSMKKHLKECK